MDSQIPGVAESLYQLVYERKIPKNSEIETKNGNHRFVAQVTLYDQALGVALAQKA